MAQEHRELRSGRRVFDLLENYWHMYSRNRIGLFGIALLAILVGVAVFASYLAPFDPIAASSWNVAPPFSQPSWIRLFDPSIPIQKTYGLLGTDEIGRDVFSEVILGSRVSLMVGFLAAFCATVVGLVVGLVSGFYGGLMDNLLMRITDINLMLPGLPLLVVLAAVLGPSTWNIVIIISLIAWPATARLIRSQVLSVKERAYVEAARSVGTRDGRIMVRHILPNVTPLLFAQAALTTAMAIMSEAGISFLGLGDPSHISWGMMLYYAQVFGALSIPAWWYFVPPGLCIGLTVLSFVFIGHALDQILNPRLSRR